MLTIKSKLDEKTVTENNELVLVLEATADNFKAGTATLVVQIEKDITVGPKFKAAFYQADYPKTATGNIAVDAIDFDNVSDKTKVAISVGTGK